MPTNTQESPSQTQSSAKAKRTPIPMNGVDLPNLFATLGAVKAQPELAEFQFRATNRWIQGTHSRTRIESYSGAGGEHSRDSNCSYDSDHPAVLCGADNAPTPVEFLLHALASCLTAGIGNIASARGIKLESVESKIEGDINLLGLLGLSEDVRNGYEGLSITFKIKGDAEADALQQVVEQSRARSAVYDVLTNGTKIAMKVIAE